MWRGDSAGRNTLIKKMVLSNYFVASEEQTALCSEDAPESTDPRSSAV
jgi:hypothetical protein